MNALKIKRFVEMINEDNECLPILFNNEAEPNYYYNHIHNIKAVECEDCESGYLLIITNKENNEPVVVCGVEHIRGFAF